VWVVVHKIITDESGQVAGGPLDSARTTANGSYSVRYPAATGDSNVTYLAITQYKGIAYIAGPLRLPRVTGEDAAIMVFDTTSPPYPLRVAGRHFVVTSPGADGRRRVVEVYELMNDSTLTVVGTDTKPVWHASLPPAIGDFQLNPQGDVTPSTAARTATGLNVFSPISPGIRQLSFSYSLAADAFPLTLTLPDSIDLLEVLVQEPSAVVTGGGLKEVAPVTQEGLTFRRLLAQNVRRAEPIRLAMPALPATIAKQGVTLVASLLGSAMLLGLGFAAFRRRRERPVEVTPIDPVDSLMHDLVALDVVFERRSSPSDMERAEFAARRAEVKARLGAALAARQAAG
jgi:hypothetical protein